MSAIDNSAEKLSMIPLPDPQEKAIEANQAQLPCEICGQTNWSPTKLDPLETYTNSNFTDDFKSTVHKACVMAAFKLGVTVRGHDIEYYIRDKGNPGSLKKQDKAYYHTVCCLENIFAANAGLLQKIQQAFESSPRNFSDLPAEFKKEGEDRSKEALMAYIYEHHYIG